MRGTRMLRHTMLRHTPLILLALLAALALALACGDGDAEPLVVLTHSSFEVSEDLIAQFEEEHNADVTFIAVGDGNELVNRAILNAGNPEGDVLYGVDNLSFARAAEAGVFTAFEAERRGDIDPALRVVFDDDSALATPINYGFVDLNLDRAADLEPPETLEELLDPEWRGLLVVEDPATSSPGLQFLATTVAYFGEGEWQEFWRGLRENDVQVVFGWSDAYYTSFSHYGGDRPLVVSYTTSPAAEVFFAEQPIDEPPTLNVIPAPLFRQVEAAAVLDGSDHQELAGEFIDFMLSDAFQQQIPETMFVYPAIYGLDLPDWWRWAAVDAVEVAQLDVTSDDVERWIREWTEIMRR